MRVGLVTTRYATALFELAREKGVLAEVEADIAALGRELATGAFAPLFDARVAVEDKRKRVEGLAARTHPLTANFLRLLLAKRRIDVLRELPAAFRRCALAERNTVEGVVESPRALGQGELAELAVAVKSVLGKEILFEQRINPDLIAGVRVFVENRLIDQSALGRLEGLQRRLKLARLH